MQLLRQNSETLSEMKMAVGKEVFNLTLSVTFTHLGFFLTIKLNLRHCNWASVICMSPNTVVIGMLDSTTYRHRFENRKYCSFDIPDFSKLV